jgi:GH24 family phage-related lysozyme (muramidase)
MHISEKGAKLIKNYEGCRLKAYKPVPTELEFTIGWGHYGVKKGTVWTQKQADEQFLKDMVKYENYVNALKRDFNQNEFDALCSFVYNCGQGNLQTLCKNRSKKQIAEAMLLYNKAGGKALEGLTKRRKAERELFLTPVSGQVKESSNQTSKDTSKPKGSLDKLPCKVKTTVQLNIREAAGTNYPIIRTAKKGEELTVWAIVTSNGEKWGKNGKEYYCLKYCEVI